MTLGSREWFTKKNYMVKRRETKGKTKHRTREKPNGRIGRKETIREQEEKRRLQEIEHEKKKRDFKKLNRKRDEYTDNKGYVIINTILLRYYRKSPQSTTEDINQRQILSMPRSKVPRNALTKLKEHFKINKAALSVEPQHIVFQKIHGN